jgi:predicted GIY-YIG superfamily endonuclease
MGAGCCLYRHFDKDGKLLYVGISISVIQRLSQHRRSRWFGEIASITIEKFPSRRDAARAEMVAIRKECPRFNIRLVNYEIEEEEWDWINNPPYYHSGVINEDVYPKWKAWAKVYRPNISFEILEAKLAEKRDFIENYNRDYPPEDGISRSVSVYF